jgi:glycine cleavage system aminomethyltransferase T
VALSSDTLLEAGTPLSAEGREVGKITSAAIDPSSGAPVALAVVKRPHNTNGSRLLAGATPVEVKEI